MLFTELTFFFFFAGLFALYWAIPSNKYRIYLLLVASAVFYGAWDWRFLGLIGFVILVVYWAHIRIIGSSSRSVRYWTLTAAVIALLGVLGVFKYFNFFADNAVFLLGSLGIPVSQPLLDIILPVGISFYVFQSIGLAIDTYRGDFRERLRFTDVAFFIAFFPQLVAGPIVRAGDFIPQIDQK
jgi:alginate O-acetyltransferase complex protein AlgI